MPAATPSGTAKNAVTSITSVEPTQAERMPAWLARREGKWVKKSTSRRPRPFQAMSANSVANVSMPIISATNPSAANSASRRLAAAMCVCRSVGFTEALPQEMAHHVAGEREDHQSEPGGEDGLVADRAVRQVAERDLNDVGGDRRRRLERIERQVRLHAGRHGEDHGLAHGTRDAENV